MEYWKIFRKAEKDGDIIELGVGSFGEVFKSGNIAEKKFNDFYDSKYGLESSTIGEFSILKKLDHPNIVHLLGSYYDLKNFYIYTPFAISDLASLIYRTKNSSGDQVSISKEKIKKYMYQISSGLDYLHHNYIAHGDLNPGNVLVYLNDKLKIADFGMNRVLLDPNSFLQPKTSPYHQPPELILLDDPIRYGMDIWQLGVIFLELKLEKNIFVPEKIVDFEYLDDKMLKNMLKIMGYPPEYIVDEVNDAYLDLIDKFYGKKSTINKYNFTKDEMKLVDATITWDPMDRLKIEQILSLSYFESENKTKINILTPKLSTLIPISLIIPDLTDINIKRRLDELLNGLNLIEDDKSFFLGVSLFDKILTLDQNKYIDPAYSWWCFYMANNIYQPNDREMWIEKTKNDGQINNNSPAVLKEIFDILNYDILIHTFSNLIYEQYQKEVIDYTTLQIGIWILFALYLDINLLHEYNKHTILGLSTVLYLSSIVTSKNIIGFPKYDTQLIDKTLNAIKKYGLQSKYQLDRKKFIKSKINIDISKYYNHITSKELEKFILDQLKT